MINTTPRPKKNIEKSPFRPPLIYILCIFIFAEAGAIMLEVDHDLRQVCYVEDTAHDSQRNRQF